MSDSAAGLILVVLEFCRTGSSAADTHLLGVSVERVPAGGTALTPDLGSITLSTLLCKQIDFN
jgi:hypothetical protein